MRPSWDEYFMEVCMVVSKRSTCLRRHVGAVLVKGKRILATGYNGPPSGLAHCEEVGCLRDAMGVPSGERQEICRALHAEQNALVQAARYGIPVEGSVLYCTTQPCATCTKMLINAGIRKVIYMEPYADELATRIAQEAGLAMYAMERKREPSLAEVSPGQDGAYGGR